MNIDNLQDFIKKQKLLINTSGDESLVLSCFVGDDKKAMFLVETETTILEDTEDELETKKLCFIGSGVYDSIDVSQKQKIELKKVFDGGKINMSKITVPKYEYVDGEHTATITYLDGLIIKLEEILCEIIVSTIAHSHLSRGKTVVLLEQNFTNHGQLPFVFDVFTKRKEEMMIKALEGMPLSDKNQYQKYLSVLEDCLCQISTINMLKNDSTKISTEYIATTIAGNDENPMQKCGESES